MSEFTPLKLEYIGVSKNNKPKYKLLEDFFYLSGDGNGRTIQIRVPEGYVTDFASVPKFLWGIFPPTGRYNPATVVHDYLCEDYSGFSRWFADSIFYEMMYTLEVPFWKRQTMYWGVRLYAIFCVERF